jgi:hypothetical protein
MIRSRSTEAAKPRICFWKPGWLPSNRSSPMLPGHSAPAATGLQQQQQRTLRP